MSNTNSDDVSIFKDAIKKLSGGPAIIAVLVLFVFITMNSINQLPQIINFSLLALVLIALIFTYLQELRNEKLEEINAQEAERKAEATKNLAERDIAREIISTIRAYDEKGTLKSPFILLELSERFQNVRGVRGLEESPYSSFIIGIGEQIGNIHEQDMQTIEKAKTRMGPISS